MLLLGIFIAVWLVMIAWAIRSERKAYPVHSWGSATVEVGFGAAFFFGLILGFILLITCLTVSDQGHWESGKQTCDTEIYSLRGMSEVYGSFFLGCGTISSNDYYSCFGKTENGAFYKVKFPVNRTVIYEMEDADRQPQADYIIDTWKDPEWIPFGRGPRPRKFHQLYVPKGTIIQKFRAE